MAFCATGLRKLDFEGSEDLTDERLEGLTRLTGLTHLNTSECPLLTQPGLSQLIARMPPTCAVFHGSS